MTQEVVQQGNCFEANFKWLMNNRQHHKSAVLCHGKVVGAVGSPVEGKVFSHAWIEDGNLLIDTSNGKSIKIMKDPVYSKGRILADTVIRYTYFEAANACLNDEHYGPWDSKLIEGD